MRQKWFLAVLLVGFAVATAGCSSPPQADIDAATAAIGEAASAGAGEYAADSLKSAEDARAALEAELKVQEEKFALFRSYTKTAELAAAAKAAGEKAGQDAMAGKEAAKNAASAVIEEAKTALTEAQALLEKAPRGKGTQADLEAMKADLTAAATSIGEAEASFAAERYLDARAKAEAAKTAATTVTTAVQQAIDARRGVPR